MSRGKYEAPRRGTPIGTILTFVGVIVVVALLLFVGWKWLGESGAQLQETEPTTIPTTAPTTASPCPMKWC